MSCALGKMSLRVSAGLFLMRNDIFPKGNDLLPTGNEAAPTGNWVVAIAIGHFLVKIG